MLQQSIKNGNPLIANTAIEYMNNICALESDLINLKDSLEFRKNKQPIEKILEYIKTLKEIKNSYEGYRAKLGDFLKENDLNQLSIDDIVELWEKGKLKLKKPENSAIILQIMTNYLKEEAIGQYKLTRIVNDLNKIIENRIDWIEMKKKWFLFQ